MTHKRVFEENRLFTSRKLEDGYTGILYYISRIAMRGSCPPVVQAVFLGSNDILCIADQPVRAPRFVKKTRKTLVGSA